MNRENNATYRNDSGAQLDRNVSRLLKLAGDSGGPGRAFTESLVNHALNELSRSNEGANRDRMTMTITITPWEKAAAVIALVCGAAFGIFVSILAHLNSVFAGTLLIAMFMNGLICYGGLIL